MITPSRCCDSNRRVSSRDPMQRLIREICASTSARLPYPYLLGIDEQRLQIAVRTVEAELASPLQALIVGAGVRDPIRRFRAFALRTGFQAGFVWH
ncbi:hypothetical protein [Burkholderia ubonensis]|uniref:hypothetical protein n=1 Tax=Burkholderia ubonensis TaxID=101571 RepID=UPI0012F7ED02|nr:hypothetical protein [Burkholderia ubonensis]